ncbi:MAG: Gfo/Idh/MocA family oxidoreductase [Sphingobacteriales bacterium]|nr:Gfo/Idh/MocA family oxidoreductase [Sphingobacteriales bacterium]OJY92321.1 MAG: oxidoreductase [Sphingobacteriales bacterium 44-15]
MTLQNRRHFIKNSSMAALGLTIAPSLKRIAPSDKLRIAHIGLGGMGNQHMKWFAGLPEVDIVALCDVDEHHLKDTKNKLKELRPDGPKIKTYGDFRRILDRKDIDAITCATPDHWHATIAALAFQAGKDVYGEKPLSYDAGEGKIMLENMNRYNRIFQMGTQIHAGDNYHRVVELVRSGQLGKIHTVRLWKTGAPPELKETEVAPVPSYLNWDMWLGPAPYTDYVPAKCHFTYRYFLDYSGGVFADFWCHIADVVFWSLDPKGLKSINAKGEKADGIADTPKWLDVAYEFEDLKILWSSTPPDVPGAAGKGIGAYFEGDKGTLLCDYNSRSIVIDGETLTDIDYVPMSIGRSPGHQQNFVDSVKNRTQPESNLTYARQLTLPMHLGMISYRLSKPLQWNAANEQFVDDAAANALLHREARGKWKLI